MKPAGKFAIVFVTAPDLKTGRSLARSVLKEHLAACVNIVPGLESHYRWKGRVEKAGEVLMILKTTRAKVAKLEKLILARHPYDVPEFLVLGPERGSADYLHWLEQSVKAQRKT